MSEQFRLVFAGEINQGQHAAVVKKRLGAVLKLDTERMDVLFSGKSVVVKKVTDKATAARYQAAFNKAGARLRVLPLQGEMQILPVGSDVLSEDERDEPVEVEVDTSHLSLQYAESGTHELGEEIAGPSVDHLTLAEAGAQIGASVEDVVVEEIDVDFDLAEPGALMDTREKQPPAPAPDTSHLQINDEDH